MDYRRVALVVTMVGIGTAGYAAGQVAQPSAKGYVVAEIAVTDAAAYEGYKPKAAALVAKYGGRYLVRGGSVRPLEGANPAGRVAVVEFDSVAQALAFYTSPEYQDAAKIRQRSATSRFFIVEGVPR